MLHERPGWLSERKMQVQLGPQQIIPHQENVTRAERHSTGQNEDRSIEGTGPQLEKTKLFSGWQISCYTRFVSFKNFPILDGLEAAAWIEPSVHSCSLTPKLIASAKFPAWPGARLSQLLFSLSSFKVSAGTIFFLFLFRCSWEPEFSLHPLLLPSTFES